jgi:diguanylate cyclase (GGDEF)-like protein/PAS domain S-box-containing protein
LADDLTIGVLSPLLAGAFFGKVLNGLAHELATLGGRVLGIQTLDATLGDGYPGIPPFNTRVAWEQVDGFVTIINAVSKSYLQGIRALGKPVVAVSHKLPGFDCPTVLPDNRIGIVETVNHLIGHGHTRIAFAGNVNSADIAERYEAYAVTLRHHDLEPGPDLLFVAPSNMEDGGDAAARDMLQAGIPATAVVAATDFNAHGIMRTLQAAGVHLPRDVALTGFDDHDFASQLTPSLASVRHNLDRLGERAGRLIVDMVRGRLVPPGEYRVKTSFIGRESCGCPGTPLPSRPGPASGRSSADVLRSNMAALLADPQVSPEQEEVLDGATEELRAALDEAVAGHAVPRQRIRATAEAIYHAFPRPETLSVTTECVQQYRRALLLEAGFSEERLEALDGCVRELSFALTQAELRTRSADNIALQASLRNEYFISMDLASAEDGEPKSLAWLKRTQAKAACLGLWAGDGETDRSPPALRLESVYGPGMAGRATVGSLVPAAAFPPVTALIARASPADIVYVLPVRTRARYWGFLAAVGPAAVVATTGRDIYYQWAAMLGSSLDRAALVESLHRQREDLARAYQRERDLVEEIRASEERYALAAGAANDGLWDWDVAAGTVFYSSRWKAMLGYSDNEVGSTPAEWFSRVHPDDRVTLEELVAARLRGEAVTLECEHRVRAKDGSYHWALCRAVAVPGLGRRATRIVGSLTDVTERKELEDRLRQAALYDPLTGLPNRSLFLDRMAQAIGRAKRLPGYEFSVLFLDLDDFKVVNDSLGHVAGDLLLVKVAERVTGYLRENDTAVRFGGDEFAVLLDNIADVGTVRDIVQRLQERLSAPYDIEGHDVVVRATVGIATSTIGYESPEDMIRDADTAMYRAKGTERGSHVYFDTSMHDGAVSRLRTEQELRQAIDNRGLELHFQPIVRLGTREVVAAEALVRWPHPERGCVPPSGFLSLAEETGLIVPLGRWVLEEACLHARAWRESAYVSDGFRVSVNLSNREFWHGDLLPTVEGALGAAGADPSLLAIELTEGVIMHNSELARGMLKQLRDLGIQLYLDDFGTGYSSLDALHRFRIDALKIDQSFVARMVPDRRSRELVRTIVMMGRNLGINVIAEGIEEPEQEREVRGLGCHYGQGYLFMKPAPAAVLAELLRGAKESLPAFL